MPPRHNYWTIIFANQPTSFRTATREELLPTFKQIQSRHPDAVMMWFAHGRLWKSEDEAREARFARREARGGRRDRGARFEDRGARFDRTKPKVESRGPRPEWKDRPRDPGAPRPQSKGRWRDRPGWQARDSKPPAADGKPPTADRKPPTANRQPPTGSRPASPPASPKPRSGEGGPTADRKPPTADRQPFRGREWRPGGTHKDPRDRFKVPRDVKRARFKQTAWRDRSHPKPAPPRKKKDEE